MPSPELLTAFAVATFVFGYMPGPGMLYATAQTLARGRGAGLRASLGLHLGGYVHVIAAAFGLALVFQAVPVLYVVLKTVGALYLITLGVQLFLRSNAPVQVHARDAHAAFGQSILVEVLNPKTALFYLAFLPQFTDPAASLPIWTQLLVLGVFVNVVFSSADVLCVLLASHVSGLLRRSQKTAQTARRLGGGILIGLGLYVVWNRG